MFTSFRRKSLLTTLTIFILLIALAACSTSETPAPPDEPSIDATEVSSLDHSLPAIMGVALDPSGIAIPLAQVGEEMGDFNGVISGDLEVSPTGWLTVDAPGYATGYAHIFGESNGTSIFEARLTPFIAGTYLGGQNSETLVIQSDEQLSIELTIDSAQFSEPDARVMMTVIDRLDVGPNYQDVDERNDLNLHYAFALQAFDDVWDEISITSGASIDATIVLPNEVSDDVVLATFDLLTGTWESIPDACTQIDSITQNCSFNRLSPLFGVFHEADIIREENVLSEAGSYAASLGSGGALMSRSPSHRALDGSQWDSQFKLAWDKITDYINAHEMDLWLGIDDESFFNDPYLLDLIDDVIDAALNFANQNRNEAGKTHLIKAQEPALLLGHEELAAPANNEAAQIAYEMGEKILKDPDCGKIQEAFKIAENNLYFAVKIKESNNQQMAQDIYDAYEPLLEKCDIWLGTITVRLPTLNTHPVEDFSRRTGSSEWMELHRVQISTNVETKKSRAEDHVRLLFNVVNYSATAFECPNSITYSSSQLGRTFLAAPGSFDGKEFVFDNFRLGAGGGVSNITQWWNFQSKYGDPPTCKPDPGGQQSIRLPFFSLLAHGFLDETPSITLQEMLDSWEVGSDVIQGSREIVNPEPDTGNIPVATGDVMWNLIHEVKLLPIDIKR